MPDPQKGKNYSLYLNAELVEKFESLQVHLGYGVSQTIANLIEVRFTEIESGVTRRQVMGEVRENLAALRSDMDLLLEFLEIKQRGPNVR